MTVREFLSVLEQSHKLRIVEGGKDLYVGYLANMEHSEQAEQLKDAVVEKFHAVPELRHRQWKERNLMPPLRPDETPDYSFSDLRMELYYTIYTKGAEQWQK